MILRCAGKFYGDQKGSIWHLAQVSGSFLLACDQSLEMNIWMEVKLGTGLFDMDYASTAFIGFYCVLDGSLSYTWWLG